MSPRTSYSPSDLWWPCSAWAGCILGISATLIYRPASIVPSDVALHDTYYLISSADLSVDIFLLALFVLIDVVASIALARISGGREACFRIAAILLCVHLALALALGLVDTVNTPLIGTITLLYPSTYLGSALGAFAATLIGLIVNGARILRTLETTS